MMNAPFHFGSAWTAAEDEGAAPVVIISQRLNSLLFAGANSVGKTIQLGGEPYRIAGVLNDWNMVPRFYNLHVLPYASVDEIFIPFTHAIAKNIPTISGTTCKAIYPQDWSSLLSSECVWIEFWTELSTPGDIQRYKSQLDNYARDQVQNGRFTWPPHAKIRNVMEWLRYRRVVPSELGISIFASLGFLLVCLLNAMGLMFAKIMARIQDISIRRALGASKNAILVQYFIETSVIGIFGGVFGLAVSMGGLFVLRNALSNQFSAVSYFHVSLIISEIFLAIVATVAAGAYPTWRASRIQPAFQLKTD
jgi:putative ABC transport system permease protein